MSVTAYKPNKPEGKRQHVKVRENKKNNLNIFRVMCEIWIYLKLSDTHN